MYSLETIALIKRARGLGINLSYSAGKVRCETAVNDLPGKLRQSLAANSSEVFQYLRELHTPENKIPAFSLKNNLPVSFSQQRFWMLEQNGQAFTAPNKFFSCQVFGALNSKVLERCLSDVVKRHKILRTTFASVDGRLEQQPRCAQEQEIMVLDLPTKDPAEVDAEIIRILSQAARQSFDMQSGPLFRCGLLRRDTDSHILFFVFHPIIADGFSFTPLFHELFTLYDASCKQISVQLPELPVQFSDYTLWQHEHSDKLAVEDKLDYWRAQLSDIPARLVLPENYTQAEIPDCFEGYPCFQLDNSLTDRLNELASQQGATLSTILLAGLVILLHRYGNNGDILVGLQDSGRHCRELEQLIGPVENTLLLRIKTSDNPDFQTFLKRIRKTSNDARLQNVPVEHLIPVLRESSTLEENLPLQLLYEYRHAPHGIFSLKDLELTPLNRDFSSPESDLALSLEETKEGVNGVFRYKTGSITEAMIHRMTGHYKTLLEAVVDGPARSISELGLLTRDERQFLLVNCNKTEKRFPRTQCLHHLFEAQAERTPDNIAIVYENKMLTYSELNSRANQLAHYLRNNHDVSPEVLVGICVTRSIDMIVGLLGILKSGGAYIPLDPGYPGERLAFMLSDSEAKVLLTQKSLPHVIPDPGMQAVYLDSDWATIAEENDANPETGVAPDNPAYVIYTSGSTGKPKGVIVLHRGIVNYLHWAVNEYAVSQGSGDPVNLSFAFDASITSIFSQLLAGKPIVLLPEQDEIESLVRILRTKSDFSLVKLTPAHLSFINALLPAGEASGQTRTLVIGGESLLWEQIAFWLEHAPDTRIINEYGPTEASVACCIYTATMDAMESGPVPIGRPIANVSLYILDKYMQPVPVGVTGELYIGGEGVARGYLNRPKLTAEKFLQDPFSNKNGARIYKTGDLARYRADGIIEYLGRTDEQVKIRGYRIEPGEIEAVLTMHPAVKEAVLVTPDSPSGKQLAAFVVVSPGSLLDIAELRRFLRAKLPEYMIPSRFTELDSIPLTAHGKIDRKELTETGQANTVPTSDNQDSSWGKAYVAPRDLLESRLAEICWVIFDIGVPIGMEDNFFDIGGDSMSALQLSSEIKKVLGKEVPLPTIFRSPTIEQIADVIRNDIDTTLESSLVPIQTGENKPPVFLMHFEDGVILPAQFRFAKKFNLDQPVYGLQAKGIDGKQQPDDNLHRIAASYADDICEKYPDGPHHLIGICHGAPLVFEVAQQLYKRGVTPGLVILVIPEPPRLFVSRELLKELKRPFEKFPVELREVVDAQHKALINYQPEPYAGKITYVGNLGPLDKLEKHTRRRWEELAIGGMEVYNISCNHDTVFEDASLKILVGKLSILINGFSKNNMLDPDNKTDVSIDRTITRDGDVDSPLVIQ